MGVQRTQLDNGISVLTEEVPHLASVAVGVWFTVGSRFDPEDAVGMSHFLEHMLFKGTQKYSALEIAKAMDRIGGDLNGYTTEEVTCYHVKVLAEDLPKALEILADMVRFSVFSPKEVTKECRVLEQEIAGIAESPEEYIHELFTRTFWQQHPLGRSIAGETAHLQRIQADDITHFWQQYYVGSNMLVTLAGGVTHSDALALVEDLFGDMPAGHPVKKGQPPAHGRYYASCAYESEQTHLCLGLPYLHNAHPQRYSGRCLHTLLGGTMSSRLFQRVREEKGLAYSIGSIVESYRDAGSLAVYAACEPEAAKEVLQLVLSELADLRQTPIAEEELAGAQKHLESQFRLALENPQNRISRMAINEIYQGHHPHPEDVVDALYQVTSDDVQQLALNLFTDQGLTLQVLGPWEDWADRSQQLSVEASL